MQKATRCFAAVLLFLLGFGPALSRGSAQGNAAATPHATAAGSQTLDLNTATPAQLKALPGIGEAYAKRIVEGRPYTAKNQLITKGIIPQGTYDKIKDQIVAHRTKA